jgi:hypothetical protein
MGTRGSNNRKISSETSSGPDAVSVKAQRDGSANSPIGTFFARIFGINTMNVTAEATAALTGPSSVKELQTPFAFSQKFFPERCGKPIAFSPTTSSCAGWHNFFGKNASNSSIGETILGLIEGHTSCDHFSGLTWEVPG